MRRSWALGALLAVAGGLLLVIWSPWRSNAVIVPIVTGSATNDADVQALREEVQNLRAELLRLERLQNERAPDQPRTALGSTATTEAVGQFDARWYLDQYVLSFLEEEQGSEFLRLAVDSRISELVDPVCGLVRDTSRVLALRRSLASMLGKKRFHGLTTVNTALLYALPLPSPRELALAALQALETTGDASALLALERILFDLGSQERCKAGLQCLRKIAGKEWNACVLRLFLRAPSLEWRQNLVRWLDTVDLDPALQTFIRCSTMEQPLRVTAAIEIGGYPYDAFKAYVEQWLSFETDAEVIAALRGARRSQEQFPLWHAMQATGEPNANPKQDDPKAWAPHTAEAGQQWLELTYAQPMVASGVRIHEACQPGAVSEVWVRNQEQLWIKVWEGTAAASAQPLAIEFPSNMSTKVVKLVLDTDRVSGWNEIDAVQLVGPSGSQWAQSACASSNYGAGASPLKLDALLSR